MKPHFSQTYSTDWSLHWSHLPKVVLPHLGQEKLVAPFITSRTPHDEQFSARSVIMSTGGLVYNHLF
jgi:hypothetical protein